MMRATLIFATVLAFATVFVSSASVEDYLTAKNGEQRILLTEANLLSPEELASYNRVTRFIGDLEIGSRLQGEKTYSDVLRVKNPTNDVKTYSYYYKVDNGIIHYLSVVNEGTKYAAVCDFPYSLGSSISDFSVRVMPNSEAVLRLFVAAH